MAEVIGRIENIEEKQAANGGGYLVVDIEAQDRGFFDWQGHLLAAGANTGDTVKIEHDGGKYRRIQSVEKVSGKEDVVGELENGSDGEVNGRERRIVRQSCLKTAVELLAQSELDYESKEVQVVELAKRMEEWVLR